MVLPRRPLCAYVLALVLALTTACSQGAPQEPRPTPYIQEAQGELSVDQVRDQLMEAAVAFLAADWAATHVYADRLLRDGYQDVTFSLRPNHSYIFLGVCDQDCIDMDLQLFDERGRLIDEDFTLGDVPLVGATPNRYVTYTVRVTIPTCYAWRCTYGVAAFESP